MNDTEMSNFKKVPMGVIGIIIGAIAIFIAIFQKDIETRVDPPEEISTTQLLMDVGKTLLKSKVLQEEIEEKSTLSRVDYTYMTLGFVALVIGVISWVKKDHVRISGAAVSLGLIAIAWEYVLIAIAVAIVLIIVTSFFASHV